MLVDVCETLERITGKGDISIMHLTYTKNSRSIRLKLPLMI